MTDMINPDHYRGQRKIEPIEVIEDWQLNYRLGNALKYISRNGRKPGEDPVEGLKKAIWYLEREIKCLQPSTASSYNFSYQDVLEDYAACAIEDEELFISLDDLLSSKDSIEPVREDYNLNTEDLHKDLDQFEEDEIIGTFERRGLIFGINKHGESFVLGLETITK